MHSRIQLNDFARFATWKYGALLLLILLAPFAILQPRVWAGFTDVTLDVGVSYEQWNAVADDFSSSRLTGGAAAGDVNGDHFPDLFVTRLDAPDLLLLNQNGQGFVVAENAGFENRNRQSNGVAMADIDNDGDQDIYVTAINENRYYLYLNNGAGAFTEQALERNAGIESDVRHFGMSTAIGDYDLDGFVDLHVNEWGNNQFDPVDSPSPWSHMRLLRNRGGTQPGHFVDATLQANALTENRVGVSPNRALEGVWSFTSTFADFDRDGYPDLAITGDFQTSQLLWNNGDGTFAHEAVVRQPDGSEVYVSGIGTDENGMGSAIADFNGDGLLDWFVTSVYDSESPCLGRDCTWGGSGNRLFQNNGDRTFTDVTDLAGVRNGHWGWGSTFFDYDNDGDLDLVMTNGMISPNEFAASFETDPMKLWQNDGQGRFTEVAAQEGLTDQGAGKGLLNFDYDLDGDLDLFVVNNGGQPVLYRNDLIGPETEGHDENGFLKVKTVGTRSNRDGIGAFLTLTADADGPSQTRYIAGGGVNYLSQSDMTVHFGLGERDSPIHELLIEWPSGTKQRFSSVELNSTLIATEPVPEPTSLLADFSLLALILSKYLRRCPNSSRESVYV